MTLVVLSWSSPTMVFLNRRSLLIVMPYWLQSMSQVNHLFLPNSVSVLLGRAKTTFSESG